MEPKATNPGAETKPGAGAELVVARVPLDTLRPYPGNPRRGDVEAIKESLQTNGLFRPIVANRRSNEVLAGNHTLRARQRAWLERDRGHLRRRR